jgi:hypothetical protein
MGPIILKSFCIVALFVFLPSCSHKSAIVGYWQCGDVQSFFEFRADGVFQTHGEVASKVTGRYSDSGGGKIKIQITGEALPKEVLVSIKGDEMIFTEKNLTMKLHRVDPSAIRPESDSQLKQRLWRRNEER